MSKKEKRLNYISAIVGIIVIVILTHQCISGLVTGSWKWGLNYYYQPVSPALQLIVLVVLVFMGIVSVWNFFFGKKGTKKEKKLREKAHKKRGSFFKYPHQSMPWQ